MILLDFYSDSNLITFFYKDEEHEQEEENRARKVNAVKNLAC